MKFHVLLATLLCTQPLRSDSVGLDFNNPKVQNAIIKEAQTDLQIRTKQDGSGITYLPWDQVPFSGWKKSFYENGQIQFLQKFENGIPHGYAIAWYQTGLMKWKIVMNQGKIVTAQSWKPDSKPCPVTKVSNGNGIGIIYGEDGSVHSELRWKEGVPI